MHEKFEPSEDLLKMQQYVRGYALQRDNFGAVRDVLHVRDMPLYVSRSYDKVCGIKVPVAKKGAPKSSIPSSGLSVVQKCVGYLMDLLKDAVEPGSRMTSVQKMQNMLKRGERLLSHESLFEAGLDCRNFVRIVVSCISWAQEPERHAGFLVSHTEFGYWVFMRTTPQGHWLAMCSHG